MQAYLNLIEKNIPLNDMTNDNLKLIIVFLRGDKKVFPVSNLGKPKLKATLSKVLQSNKGRLPLVPLEPPHSEREVVTEYKAEQKIFEQEKKAKEPAETEEGTVGNADNVTDLQEIEQLPLLQSQQFVLPMLPQLGDRHLI